MARGEWVTGVTGPELAKKWGVHEVTVGRDAGEASRAIRGLINVDELRPVLITTLQTILQRTMQTRDHSAAIAAARTLARIIGAEAPQRVEVAGSLSELLALGFEEGGGTSSPGPVG